METGRAEMMPIAMIQAALPNGDELVLCSECEATLVIPDDETGPVCPKHGPVLEYVTREFSAGAIGAWLAPETYERLVGKKSPRRT